MQTVSLTLPIDTVDGPYLDESQAIVKKYQFWRVFTAPCIFSSTPELIFGLYLIYYFRIFERQIGSNKYTV